MAKNPFVTSIVATAPSGETAPSFGIPMLVSYSADALYGAARSRFHSDLASVEDDWAPGTFEHRQASTFFAKHPGVRSRVAGIVIARGTNKPTIVFTQSLASVVAGQTYHFDVAINGVVNDASIDVVAGTADIAITTITAATDLLTKVAHGLTTGQVVYLTTAGTFPGATPALAINTAYWIIKIDDDNVKLASTYANAIAGTPIDLTSAGAGTLTLVTTGNDVLAERIVSVLNAVPSKNYTAATTGSTGSKTWTVTGSAAGNWFSVGVDHDLVTSAMTHADPGIAADLSAIRNADSSWYQLHTGYNSTAMVAAAAAWVESQEANLQYHADVCATATVNAVVGAATANDVADTLRTLNRSRTAVWYHPDPRQCLAAAVAGRCLGSPPGSVQLAHKQLSGVTPVSMTDTQRNNLALKESFAGKNANSYVRFGSTAVTFFGRTSIGEWIDVIRDNDSVNAAIEVGLYNLYLQNEKVGMSPEGALMHRNVIQAALKAAVAAKIYRDDEFSSPTISVPSVDSLTESQRRLRKYGTIKWTAQLVGAAVFSDSSGTVTY